MLLSLLLFFSSSQQTAAQEVITVSVFISGITEGTSGFTGDLDGRPFKAAVELARDLIYNDTSLLPGYQLELAFTDAKVSVIYHKTMHAVGSSLLACAARCLKPHSLLPVVFSQKKKKSML